MRWPTKRRTPVAVRTDWLPPGEIVVGFTAGASTPDTLLGETIRSVLAVADAPLDAVLAR